MTKPIKISTECGDSIDKFVDAIVKEKWVEKGKLNTAEDFYIEIDDEQLTTYPDKIHEVNFLIIKDEYNGYKTYIRHKQTFNIENKQDFKPVLDDYILNMNDRLFRRGVITETEKNRIKVYSLTKALRDQKEGKEQPYNFDKLKKMDLMK